MHPERLAFAQGELYLLAYVPEYRDTRTFAFTRITAVSLEKQTFTPRPDPDGDVFANSLGVHTGPTAPVESSSTPAWRRMSGLASGTRRSGWSKARPETSACRWTSALTGRCAAGS